MQYSSTFMHHTFYPQQLSQDELPLVSNKITMSHPKKLKTQSIQPYHSFKLKTYQRIQNFPNSSQVTIKNSLQYCTVKPQKNMINNLSTKIENKPFQNLTTNEPSTNHYPSLMIKRSGSTAPIRNRINSETNKQNDPNQQEKRTPSTESKKTIESISSIFHFNNKSKQLKLSSLVRLKSKPHMIFCSSKLPKDFFGDSIEDDHHCHDYRFLPVNLNSINKNDSTKKLKYTSSVKLLREVRNSESVQKLCFEPRKPVQKQKTSLKTEPEFTFRKQNSKKSIQIRQESTPFETPHFENECQMNKCIKAQQTPQKQRNKLAAISEPRKKQHRKYSRQLLKL